MFKIRNVWCQHPRVLFSFFNLPHICQIIYILALSVGNKGLLCFETGQYSPLLTSVNCNWAPWHARLMFIKYFIPRWLPVSTASVIVDILSWPQFRSVYRPAYIRTYLTSVERVRQPDENWSVDGELQLNSCTCFAHSLSKQNFANSVSKLSIACIGIRSGCLQRSWLGQEVWKEKTRC